MKAGIQPREAT